MGVVKKPKEQKAGRIRRSRAPIGCEAAHYAVVTGGRTYGRSTNLESLSILALAGNLLQIGKVVNRIAETDLLDWSGRVKLIDCICNFILISPEIGQVFPGETNGRSLPDMGWP
ncbi:serine/threonine-protein kinase ATM isoform X3 [Cucumis melo var. makuwa]|uniref:Serine/threonine-protein kinase ATM isoform X3 n=1 Tax=Cucumis melo var. makuwa TaxID=1194695 RepID=A0A5D3BFI0_CUCMM|nr:serine/threonine-protein kinase ATM isoform X3 [Cucumis melo var. makuwa]